MNDGMARIKANGHKAHCRKLLAQLEKQPAFVQSMPMVKDARILAGQSIELADELLRRTPVEGGDNGDAK